jgi:hypothetical protein
LITKEITIGSISIIIDKIPNKRKRKPKKLIPRFIAMTTFPNTTSNGKTSGMVIKVPSIEPLVRLNAFPKLNIFKNI